MCRAVRRRKYLADCPGKYKPNVIILLREDVNIEKIIPKRYKEIIGENY
jgi:hypothetical protein